MLQLVATGEAPGQKFRRTLTSGVSVRLGRAPLDGWQVSWDRYISREHADLRLEGEALHVACCNDATNPIYFGGQAVREATIEVDQSFRIGKTTFALRRVEFESTDHESLVAHTFDRISLKTQQFKNADHRLEVLSELPAVISVASTNEEFGQGLVRLLMSGIPDCKTAAVVEYDLANDPDAAQPHRLYWDGRGDRTIRFRPSQRLIKQALADQQTLVHMWQSGDEEDHAYTITASLDWAFCTPIEGDACHGWCLYVSGQISPTIKKPEDLAGDVRFAELLAQTTGAIRSVQQLEQQQAGLRQFFSPAVMKTLHTAEAEERMRPTERDITVLFCDIRGFSRTAERSQHDLTALLERTSEALGMMTRAIIHRDGVVADFQGDAALAFWGWPLTPEDGPLPACRAALEIQRHLALAAKNDDHPLAGFRVGIGIAHGRAIAGKIGAPEQAKVGVLGPVVNLGSRLEAMTKQLGASILLDEPTTAYVQEHMSVDQGRCRRMGRVLPFGIDTPLNVSQLLPPLEDAPHLTDASVTDFEAAVDAVASGEWDRALELLENVPGPDRAKDYLTIFIAQNNYEPPPDWDGIIRLARK